ncbi:MAG TPA: hypothetical protein PKA76_01020 [Pirellulaceae bacterium]|nr:hypothetical protein [Pirellulaceae bacterium]HMP67903.1 hypothetical protein [Pirellulaceae bacterium]
MTFYGIEFGFDKQICTHQGCPSHLRVNKLGPLARVKDVDATAMFYAMPGTRCLGLAVIADSSAKTASKTSQGRVPESRDCFSRGQAVRSFPDSKLFSSSCIHPTYGVCEDTCRRKGWKISAFRRHTMYRDSERLHFIQDTNLQFINSANPSIDREEYVLLDSPNRLMLFCHSEWYRDLILANRGPKNQSEIVMWPYQPTPYPKARFAPSTTC